MPNQFKRNQRTTQTNYDFCEIEKIVIFMRDHVDGVVENILTLAAEHSECFFAYYFLLSFAFRVMKTEIEEKNSLFFF